MKSEKVDMNLAREEFINSPLYTELLTDTKASYTALQLILENDEAYSLAIDERYEILGKINFEKYINEKI